METNIELGKSDSSGGKILLYRFGKYGKWEEKCPQSHSYSPAQDKFKPRVAPGKRLH